MAASWNELNEIAKEVWRRTGVSPSLMRGPRRPQRIKGARHLFCWLAYELTEASYPEIAIFLKKDYSSVRHAHLTIGRTMQADPDLAGIAATICETLGRPVPEVLNQKPYDPPEEHFAATLRAYELAAENPELADLGSESETAA